MYEKQIPNTDPRYTPFNHLKGTRIVYCDPPGATVPDAETRDSQALTPLVVTVGPVSGAPIPDISDWGIIIFFILLFGSALWVMRRRMRQEES